jgi:hypothetical protein
MGIQLKNTIAILLAFCFLLSITATASVAIPSITDTGKDSLYIGDQGDNTVKQFDAKSGNFIDNFVSSGSGGLDGPNGILFEKNGNLLVANQNIGLPTPGDILRYNGKTGVFETALVNYTDKNAPYAPNGIIVKDSKLYVADLGNVGIPGNVSVYNESNGMFLGNLTQNVIQPINYHPRGILFGPDGYLYVSVRDIPSVLGGHVLRFNSDGSFKDVFIADDGGVDKLNRPIGLVFGPDGNLYITSYRADPTDTDSIRIYSKVGVFQRKIDLDAAGVTDANRTYASAILFGPDGRLFAPISNVLNHGEVRRYNVNDGTYDSFIKAGGELQYPWFLTFGKTNPTTLVYPSTPTIIWDNPTDIVYGTSLSSIQLNAKASDSVSGVPVPGTFVYTPQSGTVLGEGLNILNTIFTPTDTTNYATATKSVLINVKKATPTITWGKPAAIVYGTPLSSTQLDATVSVPGTFVYTPPSGTVLNAGQNHQLAVLFTPTDIANYTTATKSVLISVKKATPIITWDNPADMCKGMPLSYDQLDASGSNPVSNAKLPGTFYYNPDVGTVLSVGQHQSLNVNFVPFDSKNYVDASKTVHINVSECPEKHGFFHQTEYSTFLPFQWG